MKLTIERSTLLGALSHAQNVVERRNTIPILSNLQLVAEPESLNLTATDLDLAGTPLADAGLGPEAVRGLEFGLVDFARPVDELRSLRVVGARVGLNVARVALRCGRHRESEFLAGLRVLGRRAVDAGVRRLRFLLELDEAGVGPMRRVEDLVQELSREMAIDLPGRHGYHCSLIPVSSKK